MLLALFIIYSIIGFIMWISVLVDETDIYEEYWFFKSRRKRKIACLLLGPGAWVLEFVKVLINKTCDLLSPLFKWLQTEDEEEVDE